MTTRKTTIKDLETILFAQHEELKALRARVDELRTEVDELRSSKGAKRGPKSDSPMTEKLAWRIRFGDLKLTKNGGTFTVDEIAEQFGVSRGQIYSIDKYTFQHLKEDSFSIEE